MRKAERALSTAATLVALATAVGACGEARGPARTGDPIPVTLCTGCHGGVNDATGAPPRAVRGNVDTASPAVGAHAAHVVAGLLAPAFTCGECHPDPREGSRSHADGTVDVAFGPLATGGGALSPVYDRAGARGCSATYCHGAFRGGNAGNAPSWTRVDGTQAACGTCHGIPPPPAHPQRDDCGSCHAGYTSSTVSVATHVDGAVDVEGLTCTSCHGDPARPPTAAEPLAAAAPPVGTRGETLPSDRAVGAHQRHLAPGALSAGVGCGECHAVPSTPAHSNGVVDVSFGPLATAGGASPAWDGATCSSTYCHGRFGGGRGYAPDWTHPAADACGTCHGVPPPAPHTQSTSCGGCHPGYTSATVDVSLHVNGTVDVGGMTCTSCHGDPARPPTATNALAAAAPPVGTRGETSTSDRAVGAHQRHLGSALGAEVACSECHAVPTSTSHATGTVAIAWGPLATSGGLTPSWNGSTCSSTYCHGSFKGGNAAYAPDWTRPSGAECGTCHGLPPPAPHPQNAACAGCHPSPILGATHVNGTIDLVGFTCTSCHGDGARLATPLNPRLPAAPPLGTRGETLATERAVGAHQRHLVEGPITRGVACSECHQVPTSLSHPTGTVELVWGRVATTAGDAPRWDGTALTCANTWCHGAFRNGNTSYAPIWTEPAATVCGTCHGVPPGGTHPQNASCGSCHTGYTATTVDKDLHVNGTVDVAGLTCSSCHGDPTRAATAVNPQLPAAPPLGTRGETSASERAVGAHQRHLAAGPLTAGVRCDECHQVPTSTMHATGTVELTWGAVARTGSVTPAWDGATCSNTYCHGNFRNGNAGYAPAWTAPAADACGTCHGVPPGGTHPQNPSCGGCHAGYTSTTVDPARHVNGTVDVAGLTCSSCHGDATRVATALNPQLPAAPPIGTRGETSASDRAVGAHQRHLNASAAGNGVACGECHQVPTSTTHATGSVEIAWGPLTTTGGASPTWNGTSCRNTYCHGNFRNGNATYAPAWTSQAADACGTCHGLPPGGTHPVSLSCGGCHDGYTRSSVDARTHMNGRVDLLPMACTSCHGDASRAGVAGADPNVAIAPPQTATLRSAGAHLPHANDGSLTSPIGCATCHAGTFDFSRPLGAGDLGSHPSGTLVVAFAGRAAGPGADTASVAWTRGGAPPTYDATSLTCAATYCHGSYAGTFAYDVYDYGSDSYITKTASFAGAQAAPAWTDGPATCGSCHGNPPPTGAWHAGHAYPQCQVCHPDATGTAGGGTGISDPTLHVNGAVDVAPQWGSSCFGCH